MDLRILTLPDEFDPAEFMLERGGDNFRELLAGARDALEHKICTATRGIDLARDTHRANLALEDILTTIARGIPTGTLDATGLRAAQLLARLARQFGLDESEVRGRFSELRKSKGLGARAGDTESGSSPRLQALSAEEVELFEILALHPDLAPTALAGVANDDLSSVTARELFQTYRRLEEGGHSLDFNSVLSEIEDPQLKHVLVQLDDLAQEKSPKAILDGPDRLRSVIRQFHQRHELRLVRQTEAALEQRAFNEQEEISVLAQVIAAKRRQQGLPAPTEG
jgi:DNA primase